MNKDLYKCSKKELISVVQDFQEMTSEIEELINDNLDNETLLDARDIILKYLCKETQLKNNLCDVFGQNPLYVAIWKNDKTQILTNPSDKKLRAKFKKDWNLIGWVKQEEDVSVLTKIMLEFYTNP